MDRAEVVRVNPPPHYCLAQACDICDEWLLRADSAHGCTCGWYIDPGCDEHRHLLADETLIPAAEVAA